MAVVIGSWKLQLPLIRLPRSRRTEESDAQRAERVNDYVQHAVNEMSVISEASFEAISKAGQSEEPDFDLSQLMETTLHYWSRVVASSASLVEVSVTAATQEFQDLSAREKKRRESGEAENDQVLDVVGAVAKSTKELASGALTKTPDDITSARVDTLPVALWDYWRGVAQAGMRLNSLRRERLADALDSTSRVARQVRRG